MEKRKKQKDVVFAIFLIFVGSVFLLNSTGIVGWGIWNHILRFWPVFLILGGFKLIFDNSAIAEIIIGVLAIVLFSLITIFSYISYTSEHLPFIPRNISRFIKENPDWFSSTGEEIEKKQIINLEDYEGVEERNLDINVGASQFTLSDDTDLDGYLLLESSYTEGYIEPSLSSEMDDNVLDINFNTTSPRRITFWGGTFSPRFDLTVGQVDIETDLNIQLGAGKGTIDLENLNVGVINSNLGAGKLELKVANNSIPRNISLELGAGKMVIEIPEDVGYELSYELGVGRITSNQESIADFIGDDTSVKSSNFDEVDKIIQINAKVGAGSLEINQR